MKEGHIHTILLTVSILLTLSCNKAHQTENEAFIYGGDFSIMKKMEDLGGVYKYKGIPTDALTLFKQNGYNYGRVRLFHTPDMEGPVCNSLDYTIALSRKIKAAGMKLLLDFHYSDTWADPQKQYKPKAWEGLSFDVLADSVYTYSKNVILTMKKAGVLPDMVQPGNEITAGMLWPEGKIYQDSMENWTSFCALLDAAIRGINDASEDTEIPVMIHIDRGGDQAGTKYFFNHLEAEEIKFDLIGLSYYPWWHGTFEDLEDNLSWLSGNDTHDIIITETAYYANGYYPEPQKWVLDVQPFKPTEQGQYNFLVALDSIAHLYPKVKGIFYWKPDGLYIPESKVWFTGRSLFDNEGNALKGLTAFK
ncbi:arabinogalactan endo-beta-1,4-galactanase [Saccharicrinis sp. FJH54]|uniref:glycoside hydrolase family 53 protein n=1 Tax=Saccharicrinis sp. FJH54 TaxID=3344665 RepID=UPI0035D432D8